MKEITIAVPEGKRAEWINGVITLVDEENVDNRPVTERIKTFEDACNELGNEHPFVIEYQNFIMDDVFTNFTQDLVAYLRLRIIVEALNEGWEPQFTRNERRFYPWFHLSTKEVYDELGLEGKGHVSYCGFSCADVCYRLAFRTGKLATYAGKQFINEWADFVFKPCTLNDVF